MVAKPPGANPPFYPTDIGRGPRPSGLSEWLEIQENGRTLEIQQYCQSFRGLMRGDCGVRHFASGRSFAGPSGGAIAAFHSVLAFPEIRAHQERPQGDRTF